METLRVPVLDQSGSLVKTNFIKFLRTFTCQDPNATVQQKYLCDYLAQIVSLVHNNRTTIFVDFQHLSHTDFELAEAIEVHYYRFEPYLRVAVQEILLEENCNSYVFDVERGQKEFFVAFYNKRRIEKIRSMRTEKIGRLISISGTVTRSSEVRPELLYGMFICKKCSQLNPGIEQQYQFTKPHVCKNATCTSNDFQLVYDESVYVDWQRLRVQENADEIPAGSMPRCIDIICRNEVVETAKAGDKVVFTGTVVAICNTSGGGAGESVTTGKTSGRGDNCGEGVTGLKKLGVKEMSYKVLFVACSITQMDDSHRLPIGILSALNNQNDAHSAQFPESNNRQTPDLDENDKVELLQMLQTPHLYAKLVDSFCPGVFGHHEVKRGILLMLFGGVHKRTPEGISLRGDINTCIVGDPSCAKSQFLKYVHEFLPHSVYTSGKSSSAAGLTASVVRDHETGEYCIEAGALMLADNGICCIDEFDKMDSSDQVAIHEAMEQQTISITKAGIQATLNARTSILAAANPVFGRYDRAKTLKANVNISAPIMSRFDLFFVILDECNPITDDLIARHIIRSHVVDYTTQCVENNDNAKAFTMEQMQKYIKFARSLNPKITKQSRKVLVDCYRLLRQNDILGKNKTAYRITVRQLESLVRLSEALARLHLSQDIQPAYVKEAYRLLQKSIIFVETEDIDLDENEEEMELLEKRVNGILKRRDENNDDDNENSRDNEDYPDNENDTSQHSNHSINNSETKGGSKRTRTVAEDKVNDENIDTVNVKKVTLSSNETKVKKKKIQIPAKDYEDMTQMLALRIKQVDDLNVLSDESTRGCQWASLLEWYLQQCQLELVNLEAFEIKKKTINQVIKRMIKHDGILVIVNNDVLEMDQSKNEMKFLQLHPSYEP